MKLDERELPHVVVGACMEVHRHLGPGLDAAAYKFCLAHELRMREIVLQLDSPLVIRYKNAEVPSKVTLDLVIERRIVVSVMSVDALGPHHKDALKNHLRLCGLETGFLVNFNVPHLRSNGIKRLIVSSSAPASLPYEQSETAPPRARD